MIFNETYTMSNGVRIPKLGAGTWHIDDDKVADVVKNAIEIGYRHIDTAQSYHNERGVGEGIRKSGIARDSIFITSKVEAEHKTYEAAAKSIDESLERMGLSYLDLVIIHSPQPWNEFRVEKRYFEENKNVWRALEDAYKAGKVKSIGVSNFLVDDLESLLPSCEIKPMINQILLHIGRTDMPLVDYCNAHDILVEAYSPIGHSIALKNPEVIAMSEKYGVTGAQLCVRYTLQLGTVSLPKSKSVEHLKNNADVDFVISDEDMETLKKVHFTDYEKYNIFPVYSGKPRQ